MKVVMRVVAALLMSTIGNTQPLRSQNQRVGEGARRAIIDIRSTSPQMQRAEQTAKGALQSYTAAGGQFECLDQLAIADSSGDAAFCNTLLSNAVSVSCPPSCRTHLKQLDAECRKSITSGPAGESYRQLFLACNIKYPRRMKHSIKLENRPATSPAAAPSSKSSRKGEGYLIESTDAASMAGTPSLAAKFNPDGLLMVPPDIGPTSDNLLYEGPSDVYQGPAVDSPMAAKGLKKADAPAASPEADAPAAISDLQPSEDQAASETALRSVTAAQAKDRHAGSTVSQTPVTTLANSSSASQMGTRLLFACSIVTVATLVFFV